MMSITIDKFIHNKSYMNFYSEKKIINVVHDELHIIDLDESNYFDENNFLNLCDDRVKILIKGHQSPFHYFTHIYGTILNALEQFENPLFIINTHRIKPPFCDQVLVEFLYYFLKDNKINYICVDSDSKEEFNIIINNFYDAGPSEFFPIPNPVNKIYDSFTKYVNKKNVVPKKKVYLSRKKVNSRTDIKLIPENINLQRIDNEEEIENFFREHGFEVIYPENFISFEQQINYFNEVAVLASISGGGAINAILMQPNNIVIELATSIITPFNMVDWVDAHHHFFSNICYKKNHTYLSINNVDKKAELLLEKLKNNEIVMNIVSKKYE